MNATRAELAAELAGGRARNLFGDAALWIGGGGSAEWQCRAGAADVFDLASLTKPLVTTTLALIAHARGHLAPYKLPKQVVFVPELPRNTAGKLLKRELRRVHSPQENPG